MIILRKIKKSTNVVISEELIGDIDGSNKIFSTHNNFIPDKISVFFNGQQLTNSYDFDVIDTNKIEFTYVTPQELDIINATYEIL
jgi:hypothetical protein